MSPFDFLLILSGFVLGSFITGMIALICHFKHVRSLRAYHNEKLKTHGDRRYQQGWRENTSFHRRASMFTRN